MGGTEESVAVGVTEACVSPSSLSSFSRSRSAGLCCLALFSASSPPPAPSLPPRFFGGGFLTSVPSLALASLRFCT